MDQELIRMADGRQSRLDEALRRVSERTPAAARMTVGAGRVDGVARLDGSHITLNDRWVDDQTDATLDFVLRHEACHHAVALRFDVEPITLH